MSIVGYTGIVPRICEGSFGHQQFAGGAAFSLLSLQADSSPGGVKIHYSIAVIPVEQDYLQVGVIYQGVANLWPKKHTFTSDDVQIYGHPITLGRIFCDDP